MRARDRDTCVAAAILAGGLGRRMGGTNKATLPMGERRIIDRQLELLRQVADSVFVVSNRPDAFADLDVTVVPDLIPGTGSLGGIYTAIMWAPCPRTLIVACDMPFLTLAFLQRLTQPSTADLVIARSSRGYEPLCATWGKTAAEPIRRRLDRGHLAAQLVVAELRVEEIGPEVLARCDPDGLLFVNVNTPHDYEQAQALSRLESKTTRDRIMDVSDRPPKPA